MLVFVSSLYMLRPFGVFAAPITNSTALHHDIAPGWVSGPKTRGTWDILYSCIFTLVLCVYTAIHLNVPAHNETLWQVSRRKTKWVIVAILAPEIVVYTAFEQWYLARKFLRELKEIAATSTDESLKTWFRSDPKHAPFNMAYAHYALMGGFAADVEKIHNIVKRVCFTTDFILFLAKRGIFCRVDRGDIEDKSKADYLAKGLVCVQVVWIVGQGIERKIANLPITLLEIHTIVHVICALAMYALWAQKPLNVLSPTLLDLGDNQDLVALALQARTHNPVDNYKNISWEGFIEQPSRIVFGGPRIYFCRSTGSVLVPHPSESSDTTALTYRHTVGEDDFLSGDQPTISKRNFFPRRGDPFCTLAPGQCLDSNIGFCFYEHSGKKPPLPRPVSISLSHKDIERLKLISNAWQKLKKPDRVDEDNTKKHLIHLDVDTVRDIFPDCGDLLRRRNRNVSLMYTKPMMEERFFSLTTALGIIPTIYGGVHVFALSIEFPTATEKTLWKVSCYFLLGCVACIVLLMVVCHLTRRVRLLPAVRFRAFVRRHVPKADPEPREYWILPPPSNPTGFNASPCVYTIWICLTKIPVLLLVLAFAFSPIIASLYCAARMFIVVESFISLRYVPMGVYQMPDLDIMGNIPHL